MYFESCEDMLWSSLITPCVDALILSAIRVWTRAFLVLTIEIASLTAILTWICSAACPFATTNLIHVRRLVTAYRGLENIVFSDPTRPYPCPVDESSTCHHGAWAHCCHSPLARPRLLSRSWIWYMVDFYCSPPRSIGRRRQTGRRMFSVLLVVCRPWLPPRHPAFCSFIFALPDTPMLSL